MLTFTINDEQGVELTFDGEDRRLAEQNAGNGATARDVALGAVVVQALKLMNYEPRMELVNNLIKAKESNLTPQSTDADDVSGKIREMDMRNVWWR